MNKKALLSSILMLSLLFVGAFADGMDNFTKFKTYDNAFNDIHSSDWYYNSVKNAYEFDLINGKGESKFDPDGKLTWSEAIKLSATINAIYQNGNADIIPDADGDVWYAPFADYLKNEGILGNSDVPYDSAITRYDFANLFAKTLPENDLKAINRIDDNAIPDVKYDTALDKNIYKLYRAGILTGSDKLGTFNPSTNIKRSEVATIVMRMANQSLRQGITLIVPYQSGDYKPFVYPYINTMYVGQRAYIVLDDFDNGVYNVLLENTNDNREIARLSIGKWHEYGDNILTINAEALRDGTAEYVLSTIGANGNTLHEELIIINVLADAPMKEGFRAPDFNAIFKPYITNQTDLGNQSSLTFQPMSLNDPDYKINMMFSYQQMLTANDFKRNDDMSSKNLQIYSKTVDGTVYTVTLDYSNEANNEVTITYKYKQLIFCLIDF